ncbi:hypothetical protein [Propioniciclava flava]
MRAPRLVLAAWRRRLLAQCIQLHGQASPDREASDLVGISEVHGVNARWPGGH